MTRWSEHLLGQRATASPAAVAIDGKTLRGSLTPLAAAVHLLAAMDQATGYVLGQIRVDSKTDEHKAALGLLQALVLEGRVITGDAMACQRELSRQIIEAGGHHLREVDDKQPTLKQAIADAFEPAFSPHARRLQADESDRC